MGKKNKTGTTEIQLATGFQNMIYDSRGFPAELRAKMGENSGKQQLEDRNRFFSLRGQHIYYQRKTYRLPKKYQGNLWAKA
jgi:hypothetical protein